MAAQLANLSTLRRTWPGWGIVLVGAGLRLHGLTTKLLWLDEFYMLELARGSLLQLMRTAQVDILPPLASLPFWAGVHVFGPSSWALRLVSWLASVAALALFYGLCLRTLPLAYACLATGLFALAPRLVYYAQEARPLSLGIFGAVLLLWAFERLMHRQRFTDWLVYALCAALAAQFYIFNVLAAGGLVLGWWLIGPQRQLIFKGGLFTAVVGLGCMGPFILGPLQIMQGWERYSPITLLPSLLDLYVGEGRVAAAWAQWLALAMLAGGLLVSAAALWRAPSIASRSPRVWGIMLGVVFTCALVVLPGLGYGIPAYEDNVFLTALPAVILLWAWGFAALDETCGRRRLLAALLPAAMLAAAAMYTLATYYSRFEKGPESILALSINALAQPGDCAAIQSEAYSAAAALQYYAPAVPVYYAVRRAGDGALFQTRFSLLLTHNPGFKAPISALQGCRRVWVVWRGDRPPDFLPTLRRLFPQPFSLAGQTTAPFTSILLSP
jgi:hypothetical protein